LNALQKFVPQKICFPAWRTKLSSAPSFSPGRIHYDAAMSDGYVDVNERLVWSRRKLHRKRMLVFAAGVIAAVVIVALADSPLERWGFGAAGAVFFCFCFYDIYKMYEPNSALIELLPQGIIFRTTSEDFIVPWNEIKGVESTDIHFSWRGRTEVYPNCTVILVSKLFYDRVIDTGNFITRGPGWGAHFIEEGDTVKVALHDNILPASAETIRREVEARWKVFGKTTPTPS
jgi:hypothetical protein